MGVAAGTVETYATPLIFEDLQNAFKLISPTECPFQQAIGEGSADSTKFEWPLVALNAIDPANRVIEGEDAPATDNATTGVRIQNFTQISDKKIITSNTSEAVDAAADNLQKIAKQMVYKMKELKRDIEWMLLMNVPAVPGSSGVARQTAGFPAFLRTNTSFGATGVNPTLSGTTFGYPNAGATGGTLRPLTESMLNATMQLCWTNGGDPSLVLVGAGYKRIISQTFTGNATRYKDTVDQKVINSIDFYESDFGTVTIVPSRFFPTLDAPATALNNMILLIDPSFVSVQTLDPVQQKPLADTGHNKKRLLWWEYGLQVDNEAACGIIRDLNGL